MLRTSDGKQTRTTQGETNRVLAVLHGEHSCPGRVARLLQQQGYKLDIRRPRFGDPLPRDMRDHAAVVFFGGAMSANDPDDYIKAEIDWIERPLAENKPFLGICLGAQMLARALGCRVYRHPAGRVEIGYHPIKPTAQGDALCDAPFPRHVYHWHREGFELPPGAELLAGGNDFEAQAMRWGESAVGLQFHPEVTYATICRWTGRSADEMREPGARDRSSHLDGWFLHDGAVSAWLESFLKRWIEAPAAGLAARAA
jgi:GMP synthase (glutamine-hydrolysing)